MDKFRQSLQQLIDSQPAIQQLIDLIQQQQQSAWLVGGALRDLVLQRKVSDLDLATSGDPTPLAQAWSRQVGGRWFWLDQSRQQSRVLVSDRLEVDFCPLRAATICEDQQLRDFTINSLAYPLHEDNTTASILDPLHGLEHLHQQQIHTCSAQSFPDDPLRMLKGIRHSVCLDMQLSQETSAELQKHAALLDNVAGERIREELGRILSADQCFAGIRLLLDSGLLRVLFGPPASHWNESAALNALLTLEQQMIPCRA